MTRTKKKKRSTPSTSKEKTQRKPHNPLDDLPSVNVKLEHLPSMNKAYPDGSSVSFRNYSFGEIRHSSTSKFSPKQAMDFALDGVTCESLAKKDLTVNDALFIGIMRKVSSLGADKLQVPYKCRGCDEIRYHVFELTDLEFHDMEAPELPITLTIDDNTSYEFWPLNLRHYEYLLTKKMEDDGIAVLAAMVTNHEFDKVYDYFDNCNDPEIMEAVTEVEDKLRHGLKPLKAVCKHKIKNKVTCDHETLIELGGRTALVQPFREGGKPNKARICYG